MHPADHPGPFAFVADLDAPELSPEDRHHLERVLRLRPGAPCTVGDGAGRWRPMAFGPRLEPTGPVELAPAPTPAVTVGFALVKGDKPELVVQKLTELGVDRIVPFRAERSVVRWDDAKAARAVARLRQVARSAAEQSHRPWLPEVADVAALGDLLGGDGVAVADRGGEAVTDDVTTVLVGPEGGWGEREVAAAGRRVSLAANVLRAETAAITAGVLLVGRRT